jgi:hypothetical protein
MSIDDYGITGGERGGGVAPGYRKGEREIAGAEDRDRAERYEHRPDVWRRNRFATRLGSIDSGIDPGSFLDQRSKHPQLIAGATGFGLNAAGGQSGFEGGPFGQLLAYRFDIFRNLSKEYCFHPTRHPAVLFECGRREPARKVHFVAGG